MVNMEPNSGGDPRKLYDWITPLTDKEREELINDLVREADEETEDYQPASRPPLPASLTAARMLRNRRRRGHGRTHSHG